MARDLILMTVQGKYTMAQCCVSMVTYCAMQDALNALELEGGPSFKNMIQALNRLKTPCDQTPRVAGRLPLPVKRAIARVKTKAKKGLEMFAVWSNGAWYCPAKGFSEGKFHERWPQEFYIDAYIEIKNAK